MDDLVTKLEEQATPPDTGIESLQKLGVIPTTSSSTTTNPYSVDAKPMNIDSGTEHTAILQRLSDIEKAMKAGFAQVMAKIPNTPVSGGSRRSKRARKTRRQPKKKFV